MNKAIATLGDLTSYNEKVIIHAWQKALKRDNPDLWLDLGSLLTALADNYAVFDLRSEADDYYDLALIALSHSKLLFASKLKHPLKTLGKELLFIGQIILAILIILGLGVQI